MDLPNLSPIIQRHDEIPSPIDILPSYRPQTISQAPLKKILASTQYQDRILNKVECALKLLSPSLTLQNETRSSLETSMKDAFDDSIQSLHSLQNAQQNMYFLLHISFLVKMIFSLTIFQKARRELRIPRCFWKDTRQRLIFPSVVFPRYPIS
jgi:hypothetical protein